jgi:hypothetical protein
MENLSTFDPTLLLHSNRGRKYYAKNNMNEIRGAFKSCAGYSQAYTQGQPVVECYSKYESHAQSGQGITHSGCFCSTAMYVVHSDREPMSQSQQEQSSSTDGRRIGSKQLQQNFDVTGPRIKARCSSRVYNAEHCHHLHRSICYLSRVLVESSSSKFAVKTKQPQDQFRNCSKRLFGFFTRLFDRKLSVAFGTRLLDVVEGSLGHADVS